MERIAVTCPECGKSFEVNASMIKITCNFCGAVFDAANTDNDKSENKKLEINSTFYFEKAVAALTPGVTVLLHSDYFFTKEKYPQTFDEYYNAVCESFKYFQKAYELYTSDKNELVHKYAEAFSKNIKKNSGKDDFNLLKGANLEDIICLYVAFAVPSILKFETEYSDILADSLLQTWNSEHKKRKLGKSTVEDIKKGFKTKLCFITTAVCDTLGLADDCRELQSFRLFRDDYLINQPGGKEQVQEYYLIAPLIVKAIDASPKKDCVYASIWNNHLSNCLEMYEKHDYEQCREAYTQMVDALRDEWL